MAQPTTGLFETLVAAFSEAAAAPMYANVFSECIYTQYRGISAQYGQTLQVNLPTVNEGDVNDIGAGPIQLADPGHATVNITINQNKSTSFIIKDFDQVRTPQNLRVLYTDAKREGLLRKVNRSIASLITAANFASYTAVTGGASLFTRPNLATAWSNIVGAGAPVREQDTFFITSHVPYATMLGDSTLNFLQQYIVGEPAAVAAQQRAVFAPQFQAQVKYDQQTPITSASKYTGLFFHRYAIAMIPVQVPLGTGGQAAPYVQEGYVFLRPDLPARLQTWYDPVQQGQIVHLHVVYGLQIVRPEFASYCVTN